MKKKRRMTWNVYRVREYLTTGCLVIDGVTTDKLIYFRETKPGVQKLYSLFLSYFFMYVNQSISVVPLVTRH